jgi:hypothetical protein
MKNRILPLGAGALVLFLTAAAQAGPTLLCHPFEIGDAASLPWSENGWNSPRADYDRARLVDDTVARLGPDVPVLVRMETLRRAALYAGTDAKAAEALLARLQERAEKNTKDSLALFDAGYLSALYRQVEWVARPRHSMPQAKADANERVQAALALRGADPEMEYAAALLFLGRPAAEPHLARAVEGAKPGTRLARTLAAHEPLWGTRLTALRAAHPSGAAR